MGHCREMFSSLAPRFSFKRLARALETVAKQSVSVIPSSSELSGLRLESLRGVGPFRAAQLARLGLHSVEDLFLHRPRRLEDRRHSLTISQVTLDAPATIRGHVVAMGVRRMRARGKSVFELVVEDSTGRMHARWWNLPYMQQYFRVGEEVFVYGKAVSLRPITMDHPETETIEAGEDASIHLNRIVPVYGLTEGLPQRWIRALMWRCLGEFLDRVGELWTPMKAFEGHSRRQAIWDVHFPECFEDSKRGRERLALDEFVALQIQLQVRRRNLEAHAKAMPCAGDNRWMRSFLHQLGFSLTPGQTGVLKEIRRDLGGNVPMRRLLQGDVGCGKTIVSACAALMALESGYSVALMAPTEILAEQHYQNFVRWWGQLPISIELRTGTHKQERKTPDARDSERPTMVIGTHALVQDSFSLPNLGLVIIDEQHKFGVGQRESLVKKGNYPHLLVMTATPIPRTLGLTLYGDLDISVIPEAPSGRGSIRTYVRSMRDLSKVWAFVRAQLQEGRQAYVVYPRVEESGPSGVKSVKQEFTKLQSLLAPFSVGLLHGKLASAEKQSVLESFRSGALKVLVSTSVIEVGIDVANATVMVIENAEQFGLAQLHQLRGRIGRGKYLSYCVLVGGLESEEASARLRLMEQTQDGFRLAEADLKLRGPGELVGQEQSGLPPFRFADLRTDLPLVDQARHWAALILSNRGVMGRAEGVKRIAIETRQEARAVKNGPKGGHAPS